MNNNNTSQKVSFLQLLSENSLKCNCCNNIVWKPIFKVEIPIIQRDYAQGRDGKEELRKNFLNSLLEAVDGKPLELDFVYGNIIDGVLKPLDGQQRLTTLFLLHWFVAVKEKKLNVDLKKLLKKFTYETRTSSSEFCEELIEKGIIYNTETKISELIIDNYWFFLSWKKDPTIKSMLTMLDAIQQTFHDKINVLQKLEKITFHFIELQNFGLSDDLYIKMNARGKPLTAFENFKAKFEQYIKKVIYKTDENGDDVIENGEKAILKDNWEKEILLTDENKAQWKTLNEKSFSHKIDTYWTDLFWENHSKNNTYDEKLMKFFTGIAINYHAQSMDIYPNKDDEEKVRKELELKRKIKKVSDKDIVQERIEKRITSLFNNPHEISPLDYPTKQAFEYLVSCLDIYAKNNFSILRSDVDLWKYCIDTPFKDIIQNKKSEWQNRVVFYAQTQYLLKSDFNKKSFNDWMRVVRNIVENSTIDSAGTFISAVKLINELSSGYSDIYKYLSINRVISGHAEQQVKEEIEKAKIIVAQPDSKQIIHDTEDTNFCRGKIDFALYCIDYDITNPNLSVFDKKRLESIFNVMKVNLANEDVTNNFRRAFLTINNDFYKYWSSGMWYGKFDRYCLLENTSEFKHHFALRGTDNKNIKNKNWLYSKVLLNKLTNKSLDDIIDDYIKCQEFSKIDTWKQIVISKSKILDESHRHYICRHKETNSWFLVKWNSSVKEDNWNGLKEIK